MNVIAFGYPEDPLSERYLVVKHIHSLWIRPSNYQPQTDKVSHWMICVDLGNFSHSAEYDDYGKAIAKYNEILDAIAELKE